MAEVDALTHAFMLAHPADAARVLEAAGASPAAELLGHVPARLGSGVLAAMLPGAGARLLAEMPNPRALELLGGMDTLAIVGLLRQMPEARRKSLLAGLPTGAALASTLLLGYPEDSLGACCDPDVVALGGRVAVAEALAQVRQVTTAAGWIFVTGSDRQLGGWIPLATLLRAPEGAPLETVAEACPAVLAAHAPVLAGLDHPGWSHQSTLPVVEPGNRLIGILSRETLVRVAARKQADEATARDERVAPLLARAYWEALSGVVEAALGWLPAVRPIAGGSDER